MELDRILKVGSSQISIESDPSYINFKGDRKALVLKTKSPQFTTSVVGNHERDIDSEAKLFEYAAEVAKDGKPHTINLLSEKCMCESCRGVMRQFMRAYPNVTVNAVSNSYEQSIKIDHGQEGQGNMRADEDLTYQEYKEGVIGNMNLIEHSGWTVKQVTDWMTEEDNDLLVGTSEALWIISIGAYEVEHDILEERVLEQLSYHIPRYEMGKYSDITPEEKELLEKDIAYIKSKVELWKLKSYDD